MFSVNTLFNDLNRLTHKGSLNQTSDIFGAVAQGGRAMLSRIQPPELERNQFIEQALYHQVNRYAVPQDLDGNKIISMKWLPSRHNVGSWTSPLGQSMSEDFGMANGVDQYGSDSSWQNGSGNSHGMYGGGYGRNSLSIQYENGVKYVLLPDLSSDDCKTINKVESLTVGGTWNVYGNVVNLREDPLFFITGKGSLMFDFNTSSSTGALEVMLSENVDLHDYVNIGAIFNWLQIIDFQKLISVKLIWASSLTDWYEYTVTAPHDNNQFVDGWNLLKFPFQNMTTVNTPNPAAINRVKIEFVTTGQSMINNHIDNIVARKGKVFSVNYYSSFLFRDFQTGAWKQFPTSGNDIINLEYEAYQILLYETADAITQEITGNFKSGGVTSADHIQFRAMLDTIPKRSGDLNGLYWQFNSKYKNKLLNPSQDTYHFMDGHL